MAIVKLITNPTTKPPGDGAYVAVEVDGKEKWFLLSSEAGDGVVDADFDFGKAGAPAKKPAAPS